MLYRFGKAETGINEAIQHRFQAGSKHGFRSFRLFFGFRIEINRNKTIHPPIRQPGIRRRPPDKETVNRGNRAAGKVRTRGKPGHESRTEPNGGYRIQPSWPEYLNFPGDAGHSGDTNLRDTPDSGRHGRPKMQAPMQHPAHTESHRAGADAAGIR
ncbi:MAG: hypothetical protein BHV65_12190 [Alistipes sp. 58_9_plus]|nr:MAG: hypothetical protein BHV65_12190 [Alistipes sp. 58_9_plus]